MFYIKICLTALFLSGTIFSFIYNFNIFYRFLGKRLSKNEAILKTFVSTFWGFMFIFLSYLTVEVSGNIVQWIFPLIIFTVISFLIAIASIAPYWQWNK